MMQISQGTLGSPWHQGYHSSSSASDLSSYDHGCLRRSLDQYSSRGSMESLDHASSAYHPCQLSPAKSTNSIDQLAHLHNKRDSAYSSFSTNSSIPEYHPTAFCKERSYSMESMFSRGNLQDGIKHADIRYIKTVYDAQRGVSEEYEVNLSTVKNQGRLSGGYVRNNGGPVGRLDQNRVFSETDIAEKGPPMPPTRSDSYAVTKHHERPSSWSSLDQNRTLRIHSKGPGSHPTSATCNTNQQLKPLFGEGQLHTVLEKSPECSPLMKPKQMYSQVPQPGQPMLPAGIYPVPSPEPHFAHAPQPLKNNNGKLYPALAKEGAYCSTATTGGKIVSSSQSKSNIKNSQNIHNSSSVSYPVDQSSKVEEKKEDGPTHFTHYKPHFSAGPEISTDSSLKNENERTISKVNNNFSKNDQQPKSESRIKTQRVFCGNEQANGNVQVFNNNGKCRSRSVPAFQNHWNPKHIKPDLSTVATGMDLYRNNNIDTNKDKDLGCQYNTISSLNNKLDDIHSPLASDHRNKLDSPSFTKHIEDIDSSVMSYHLQSEEPSSPPHKNSVDFTRRRLSSGSNQSGNNLQFGRTDVKQRSSVLDKISKIEQREQECQKSQVSSGSIYGQNSGQSTRGSSNRASVNSIEELRNKFNSQEHVQGVECHRLSGSHTTEKGIGVHQLKRGGSAYNVKLEDIQKATVENQVGKTQAINQEQHVLQALADGDKIKADSQTMPNKEDHWQSTAQYTLGFSRAYRNSIKDAQSKVLEATSYRRKDLEISPPQYKKQERSVKRPTSAVLHGKTPPVSPHAPKERHSVTPTDTFAERQEFQNQEGTGVSYQVPRIGARKRLTTEQKKRSYSEPEKMNEVGASDNESSSTRIQKKGLNISFLDQTVADRRRMFERDDKACSTVNLSKPELKQLQQNALADYIERKTGRRPSSQETGFLKERSQSTYFSGSFMDNQSISSMSSMNSLQEHNMSFSSKDPREKHLKTRCVSSTLPPGLTGLFDFVNVEKKNEHQENRGRSSSFVQQRLRLDCRSKTECKSTTAHKQREITASKPLELLEVSAASPEDLLQMFQQPVSHVRTSPAGEKRSQDFMVKQEAVDKNVSFTSANKGFRSSKSKTEDHSEKATYESAFQPYTGRHTEGENQVHPSNSIVGQSIMERGIQRHTRAQSLTATGSRAALHNTRPANLSSPNNRSPSKKFYSHNTVDFITAEEYLYTDKNRNPGIFPDEVNVISDMDLNLQDNNLLDYNNGKVKTKSTPPQRPPPPKIKFINSEKEGNFSQNTHYQKSKQIPSAGSNNNAMWSSSSSEPETPSHNGKISLRISESCLQPTSPVVGHDEEDDEVFVKEQDLEILVKSPFVPPSPPPFPPPTLEDALFKESQEKTQPASVDRHRKYENKVDLCQQDKEDLNERYPVILDDLTMEKSSLILPTSSTPVTGFERPLIDVSSELQTHQLTASSVGADQSSLKYPPTQDNAIATISLELSDNKIPTYEGTLSTNMINMMSPEDVKSQELAKEIVNKDKSLADILDPELKMKTTMDLMVGLFVKSTNALRENNRRWMREKMPSDKMMSAESGKKEDKKNTAENAVSSSVYYSMSAPEAELLRKIADMHADGEREEGQTDVNEKKAELIASLTQKLEILKGAKESLLVEIKLNNSLGEEVETLVEDLCKPNEFDKYKMFIGDLDKVVNLLLSLSGRLAKVENVLCALGEDANAEERNTWNVKRKQLCSQHEDARELKENLDRREKLVTDILGNYFNREQFQDYQHFVKMKSALLIEQRELDDKIKLGQEQLNCLLESLPRDFIVRGKVPSREEMTSSSGNVKILPSLTTSL
ncbi:protein Shroom3 [Mixophyes fleayi]|uniref:protein Shroom3 n=1 Tax=Mixophyes fleayi TaxID=3061075 RepID=UPI003F4DDBF8